MTLAGAALERSALRQRVRRHGASSCAACLLLCAQPLAAQVITDGSLGAAVTMPGPIYFVDETLGQTRGSNLFHSFSTFNIGNGQSAFFPTSPQIANIIARITGTSATQIDGQIFANANLFLLNPRGVILGSGASLNIEGSFHASTADYLRLADGARFYASLGAASTLSFAAPSAFGFLAGPLGSIAVNGAAFEGARSSTLTFVAGDVTIQDASLSLEQGRIGLVGVGSAGEANLGVDAIDTSSFSAMGSVHLDGALVNAEDEPGTSVYIRAGQLVVENQSLLVATNTQPLQRATIDIEADHLQLRGSAIASSVTGTGSGANIAIRADQVAVDGAALLAISDGSGRGGNVSIDARTLTISGAFSAFGTGSAGGTGGGGDVSIRADIVDIANGGLAAVTAGPGAAGNVAVTADQVTLRSAGAITSGTTGAGRGGSVNVTAQTLTLDGSDAAPAAISATTSATGGGGSAGSITIDADTLLVRRANITTNTSGSGNGGRIAIDARNVSLEHGGTITTETGVAGAFGPAPSYGAGGSISIVAESAQVFGGARISADTFANGAGGSVDIVADRLIIDGEGTVVSASSGSAANTLATGAGGSLTIDAFSFELRNRASLSTSTFGVGAAGQVLVSGDEAIVTNGASISASSFGQTAAAGAANDIRIDVSDLAVSQGGQISNATHGLGSAGRLVIDSDSVRIENGGLLEVSSLSPNALAGGVGDLFIAADRVVVSGGSIQARSVGGALPGSIAVSSRTLTLDNGAVVTALSASSGNAGDIALYASESLRVDGFAQITTEAQLASGGNIAFVTDGTLLMRDALVSTSVSGGAADGGNVLMSAALLMLDDSSITARAFSGNGGRIDIASPYILSSATALIDASSTLGIDGQIGVFGFDIDLNADIAPLPADFSSAQRWLSQPCARRLGTHVGQLVVAGRDGAYRSPGDLAPSPLDFSDAASPVTAALLSDPSLPLAVLADTPCF